MIYVKKFGLETGLLVVAKLHRIVNLHIDEFFCITKLICSC